MDNSLESVSLIRLLFLEEILMNSAVQGALDNASTEELFVTAFLHCGLLGDFT